MSSSTQLVLPSIAVPPATDLTDLWNGTNYALQQMTRQMQVLAGGFNVTKTTVDPTGGSSGGAGLSVYPLDANSVGTTQLVDTSIINSKIAANAVQTTNILDSAITTLKIANSAVTSAQVAVNTITGGLTGNLASATITAYNIVAQTITAGQIAASTILGSNIAAATITGGNIAALTITASNIAANTITASQIAAGTITSTEIAAGTIIGNNIAANTITAGLLNVSQLSAISADLGTITAGTITVSSTGFIRGGQTAYNTGTGWWLGYDTTAYKLSIGSSSSYITWDGSAIKVSGTFSVGSGVTQCLIDTVGARFGYVTGGSALTSLFIFEDRGDHSNSRLSLYDGTSTILGYWDRTQMVLPIGATLQIDNIQSRNTSNWSIDASGNATVVTLDVTSTVKFGTYTASAGAPIVGYITITDAGGTTRHLACV